MHVLGCPWLSLLSLLSLLSFSLVYIIHFPPSYLPGLGVLVIVGTGGVALEGS